MTDSLHSLVLGGWLIVIDFTGGELPTVKVNLLLLNNIDVVNMSLKCVDPNATLSLSRAVKPA